MRFRLPVLALLASVASVSGQWWYDTICPTDVPYATGPNNGHKLASHWHGQEPGDSLTLTFQSSDGIHLCYGSYEVPFRWNWSAPGWWYPGRNPAIACGRDNHRYLVWEMQDTATGWWDVYYRDLNRVMEPVNVSRSAAVSCRPDIWAEDSGLVHVVWEEQDSGRSRVIHQLCGPGGLIGPPFVVSRGPGSAGSPSADVFLGTLWVMWAQQESTRATDPSYSIRRRGFTSGAWQPEEILAGSDYWLGNPAMDLSSDYQWQGFAGCWEQDSAGNLDVRAVGIENAGVTTPGASTAPVVGVSGYFPYDRYLCWQEESAGQKSVSALVYWEFEARWDYFPLSEWLGITEQMQWPACIGRLLVWTQGDTAPYFLMYTWFEPPAGVTEQGTVAPRPGGSGASIVRGVLFLPRLGTRSELPGNSVMSRAVLLDASGRKVMDLRPGANDVRHLPSGIYFVHSTLDTRHSSLPRKVVIQR